jgi:hypothetical protein
MIRAHEGAIFDTCLISMSYLNGTHVRSPKNVSTTTEENILFTPNVNLSGAKMYVFLGLRCMSLRRKKHKNLTY